MEFNYKEMNMEFNYKEMIPEKNPTPLHPIFLLSEGQVGQGLTDISKMDPYCLLNRKAAVKINCFPYLKTTLIYKAITQLQTLPFSI